MRELITGFDHTSFSVSDVERAVHFWSQLGFTCPGIAERHGSWVANVTGVAGAALRVAHLHGHGMHLEFIEYIGGPREPPTLLPNVPGVGHICLKVRDIHATAARMFAAGATPLGDMTTIADPGLKPCAAGYLRDPNGIVIELLEMLEK